METEKIEQEYMYYKTALAIALIRMKPEGISLDHFVQCFQANFRKDYKSNREQINELKEVILQTKQELFMLKNKELIMQAEENYQQNESKNIKVKNDTDKEKEIIFESLFTFLSLINEFFFDADLLVEDVENPLPVKPLYPMPKNALEHAISIFMNIFDIEFVFCFDFFF